MSGRTVVSKSCQTCIGVSFSFMGSKGRRVKLITQINFGNVKQSSLHLGWQSKSKLCAKAMGTMKQTLSQICEKHGVKQSTARMRLAKHSIAWQSNRVATEKDVAIICAKSAVQAKSEPAKQPKKNREVMETKPAERVASPVKTRSWILYMLMVIPAAASIQNIHGVTIDISRHESTAILLTALFSGAPFLFVLAGMKSLVTRGLTAALIGYECFCNLTRIFGWLTDFGGVGYPTRFLGLVTEVFNSGTHYTALALAALMSLLAASVFYVAYNELNK